MFYNTYLILGYATDQPEIFISSTAVVWKFKWDMRELCPPGYCQSANDLMVTHAFGHMVYGYTLLVPMDQREFIKSRKEHNKTI